MGKYFGTDGVRGVANTELTPELAFKLGRFGGYVLAGQKLPLMEMATGSLQWMKKETLSMETRSCSFWPST